MRKFVAAARKENKACVMVFVAQTYLASAPSKQSFGVWKLNFHG